MDESAIVLKIVGNKAWSEQSARLCVKAGFKCEYCDLNFLDSPVAYKQIQFDHIVPRTAGGSDAEANLAAVCRTCNWNWKARWNPALQVPEGAGRPELVAACRRYVKEQRRGAEHEVASLREILQM